MLNQVLVVGHLTKGNRCRERRKYLQNKVFSRISKGLCRQEDKQKGNRFCSGCCLGTGRRIFA